MGKDQNGGDGLLEKEHCREISVKRRVVFQSKLFEELSTFVVISLNPPPVGRVALCERLYLASKHDHQSIKRLSLRIEGITFQSSRNHHFEITSWGGFVRR